MMIQNNIDTNNIFQNFNKTFLTSLPIHPKQEKFIISLLFMINSDGEFKSFVESASSSAFS